MNKNIFLIVMVFSLVFGLVTINQARDKRQPSNTIPKLRKPSARPETEGRVFDIGTLWNTVTNKGQYGHTDQATPSMEWAGGTEAHHLWEGRFWIGALLEGEKHVTHADFGNYEWYPKEGSSFFFGPGKSILDSYVQYDDLFSIAGHTSLGIEVRERGLSWSMGDFDDFNIMEYEIINVGKNKLRDLFVAWVFDCDICAIADPSDPHIDDLVDYEGWDGNDTDTDLDDWVDPLDLNGDGETGYDEYGWPYGYAMSTVSGPKNPNYDPAKAAPDGFYDEWSIMLDEDGPVITWQTDKNWKGEPAGTPAVNAQGDTLKGYLFPRSASFMFDGDHASTPEVDIGERDASQPIPGFAFGQLLYSDIIHRSDVFPYNTAPEDTFMRAFAHQWWNWESDPPTDIEKYDYMSAQHSASTQLGKHYNFIANPIMVNAPVFDYRWVTSTGPFTTFNPGDTIRVVYVMGVGLGHQGMRENIDNAIKAYYAGAEWSNPVNPSAPAGRYKDNHYVLPIPPPVPDLTYSPLPGGIQLAWDNKAEIVTDDMLQRVDFEGYKIYRSMYNPSDWQMIAAFDNRDEPVLVKNAEGTIINAKQGPNGVVAYGEPGYDDIEGNYIKVNLPDITHTYKDFGGEFLGQTIEQPINGLRYFYTVVAYDPDKPATPTRPAMPSQESARSNYLKDPESGAPEPILPSKLYEDNQADVDMEEIKVVPNPYKGTALFESRYEDKITFTNLPPSCKITIFTIAGDLIDSIFHNDGSAEHVWDLISRNQQKVVSGLYVYVVETEEPEYKKHIGKFVIIR